MSQREKPATRLTDDAESLSSQSLVTQVTRARMARLSSAGVSGLGASTMAFVAGGCLALGYFAGTWLDNRYSTTHWMPIGVFVGLAASVREMFRTLKHLNEQTKRDLQNRQAAKQQQIDTQGAPNGHRVRDVARDSKAKRDIHNDTEPETIRPRIFHVPPPPLASFDKDFVPNKNEVLFDAELNEDELKKLLREIESDDARDEDESETKLMQ